MLISTRWYGRALRGARSIRNTFLHCLPVDCPSSTPMMTSAFWMSHCAQHELRAYHVCTHNLFTLMRAYMHTALHRLYSIYKYICLSNFCVNIIYIYFFNNYTKDIYTDYMWIMYDKDMYNIYIYNISRIIVSLSRSLLRICARTLEILISHPVTAGELWQIYGRFIDHVIFFYLRHQSGRYTYNDLLYILVWIV